MPCTNSCKGGICAGISAFHKKLCVDSNRQGGRNIWLEGQFPKGIFSVGKLISDKNIFPVCPLYLARPCRL